jgi:hypothetical protein
MYCTHLKLPSSSQQHMVHVHWYAMAYHLIMIASNNENVLYMVEQWLLNDPFAAMKP